MGQTYVSNWFGVNLIWEFSWTRYYRLSSRELKENYFKEIIFSKNWIVALATYIIFLKNPSFNFSFKIHLNQRARIPLLHVCGQPPDILYNEHVNSFFIVTGCMPFVTKNSWRSPRLKVTSKKTNMKILRWSCIRWAQFHEGCRLKEYLHRPNDLFCLPANHLLHWKSIYIKANQNVSTSLFPNCFKMLWGGQHRGQNYIYLGPGSNDTLLLKNMIEMLINLHSWREKWFRLMKLCRSTGILCYFYWFPGSVAGSGYL